MFYLNSLKDLNQKSADMETIYMIRDLKKETPLPLSEEKMRDRFMTYFISENDKEAMQQSLEAIEPTMEAIKELLKEKDPDHEPVDLQRAIAMLSELHEPLQKNIEYATELSDWQKQFITEITAILNEIPRLKTKEEKAIYNKRLEEIFAKILRTNEFKFNAKDIVSEAQVKAISGLNESMARGFFFHITLEEEIKKLNFDLIKSRIPDQKLERVDNIGKSVAEIKKGIDEAYKVNMRAANWALILYAYIRWLG